MLTWGELAGTSGHRWAQARLPRNLLFLLLLLDCSWGAPVPTVATPAVDFCASCHPSAKCFQKNGKSICICNYGFIGNGRTSCNDKDECQIGAANICGNHSACHNTYGSFYCTCHEGFRPFNNNHNNTYIPNDGTYCTAVDCGTPLVLPNTFIDSKNKTTFGNNVTYRCQKGFAPDSGSSTSTCTADGKWEGASLVCKEIDCGPPPVVARSKIAMGYTTVFGSKAQYSCVEGFRSNTGTNVSACTEQGIWETPSLICKAVDCGEPPLFLNTVALRHSSTIFGSVVVYECRHGYATEGGNTTAVCNARGEWEGAAPVCRAVECGLPPAFRNAQAVPHCNTTYGSVVIYECQYGYTMEGGNTIAVCNARGQWEGADPVCRAVDCGQAPLFLNALARPHSNTTYGSAIVYECRHGYTLEDGNTSAVCNARGQWEGADPLCRAVDCGPPPPFWNAQAGPHFNTTYGSAIVYECQYGYTMEGGNTTAVCNAGGQWEGADPVCRAVDCGTPPSFRNASAGSHGNTTYGSVVVYECDNGYSAESGNQTAVCNGSGRWEGANPVCTEIDCGAPPVMPHAQIIWNNTTKFASVVHYQCLQGFYGVGNGNRSACTMHGKWESITFSCQEVHCGTPPMVPHTNMIWDNSTRAGSVVLYACQKGFHRTGGRNLSHCTSNGSWELPDVKCKAIDCGIPKKIENANQVWSGKSSMGSHVHYVCKKGFTQSGGTNYSLCSEDGIWEESSLTCTVAEAHIISDLFMFNESCVKWRKGITRSNWKLSYSVHIHGSRWYQKEFSHTRAFNFSAVAEAPMVCLRLSPSTSYTVNVSATSPEGLVLTRTIAIQTSAKKFIINVTALNETCLQWRNADGERMYHFHVLGSRWYQKDFSHHMMFNITTDAEIPVVCLDLRPGTNYTVNITSAYSRSFVDFFMTTRIADPQLPEIKLIETQTPTLKLTLLKAEERNGPISSYQILVLPCGAQLSFNCDTQVRSSYFSNVTNTEGYVAAEILPKDFLDQVEFPLGDRQYYGDFYNAPLRRGKDYCIILRITSEWHQERAQSCTPWAHIKDTSPIRKHVTVVGVSSLAVVCFFLFISFSAAWCCKRR
ncbi:sushi domain-containing protein 1 [Ambystoma mexicanum]|uniref:sushi domain-containing protein 1 n=1 Tax=Ambystoma mexicanum TaxID=8296 RepID=UPI0037E919AE